MNNKFKTLLAAALFMTASPVMAEIAGFSGWEYGPFIGVDVQLRHIKFVRKYGTDLFKKNYIQGNPFVGVRFNDYFGIEVGYDETVKKNASVVNAPGTVELGVPILANINQFSNNTFRMKGANANLYLYAPFCVCDENFDFYALVGAVYLKAKMTHILTGASEFGQFVAATPEEMQESKATFIKRKLLTRAGLGLQYKINCNVGVRASFIWENTKKIRNLKVQQIRGIETASLKDSMLYGLGVFWQF